MLRFWKLAQTLTLTLCVAAAGLMIFGNHQVQAGGIKVGTPKVNVAPVSGHERPWWSLSKMEMGNKSRPPKRPNLRVPKKLVSEASAPKVMGPKVNTAKSYPARNR
jgi:hypothetical protein